MITNRILSPEETELLRSSLLSLAGEHSKWFGGFSDAMSNERI